MPAAEEKPNRALASNFPRPGKVTWIGIRPEKGATMLTPQRVEAIAGRGLAGDCTAKRAKQTKRQVTLIQGEHLDAVCALLGKESIDPNLIRRNIVVRGINLQGLKEQAFKIGEATLLISGPCHPCFQMEDNLGFGGYNAMRGHGGWCCTVEEGGDISIGDEVRLL